MANSFDTFPLYDNLLKAGTNKLSDVWKDSLATFSSNLNSYLTGSGILMPQLTTTQIAAIQSPVNGQMVYNVTTNELEVYKAGSWRTVTTS